MNKLSKYYKFILGPVALLLCLYSSNAMASKANSCTAARNEFRTLYLELQAKFLNYSGKDTTLDKNGKIVLVDHKAGTPYEGKDFELAIFKQYQNALKKVGLVYQQTRANKDEFKDSYPQLVGFLEAIDKDDPSSYIKDAKIDAVVKDISRMSQSKYANSSTPGHAISKSDEYLLKKLLIHAIDSICGTSKFQETREGTKYYDKTQLERQLNAPLNRMIKILKNADITDSTDIKIFTDEELEVNGRVAVHSAIAEHMQKLAKWARENQKCMQAIKNSNFIQAEIQPCNYQRFLTSLGKDNFDDLESILHFINANDKFIDKKEKLADTDINPIFLESMIDQTFANLGDKVVCTIIPSDSGKNIVYIRNLPYDQKKNKFDTSAISCSVGGQKKSKEYCDANLTFTSNKYGNGLEIGQKNPKGPIITFSVEGDPNCNDIHSQNNEIRDDNTPEKLTLEFCQEKGQKETPPRDLILSEDGLSCVENKDKDNRPSLDLLTQEICDQKGKEQDPPVELFLSEDKKSCDPKTPDLLTQEKCDAKGNAEVPPVKYKLSTDQLTCELVNDELTQEKCDAQAKAAKPPVTLKLSADKKSCEPVNDGEAKCTARNKEWIEKENEGRPGIAYEWDGKACVNKLPKKAEAEKGPVEAEPLEPFDLPEGQPPGRFVPLSNPTTPMYILQGWP